MKSPRLPLWLALVPVVMLIAMLAVSVYIFGDASLEGPSQWVLIMAVALAAAIGMLYEHLSWQQIETAMVHSIGRTMPANLILLLVGTLCGTWMHAGIIPTMIYYGLEVISARWILLTACVICSLVSLCIGSSWTTIATVGVGLCSIGRTLGVDDGWIAGAIISGAYFGDKMSPLSETTNLASSMAGVPLFEHIRNMMRTTVPSVAITLLAFAVEGFLNEGGELDSASHAAMMQEGLAHTFCISPWLLLVPLFVFFLIYKGVSATIVLFLGSLSAMALIPLVQSNLLSSINGHDAAGWLASVEASMRCAFGGVEYATGYEAVDSLTSTGGMKGMLNTVWLIVCAMCFGGVLEETGMLQTITERLISFMSNRFRAVSATCLSSMFLNIATGDQCLSIILPAKMYGQTYKHLGLEAKLLSRSLEDGGTVTSVLIPWNSCGMTQATVLGVATVAYAPYCIFCWISPLMSMAFAFAKSHTSKR